MALVFIPPAMRRLTQGAEQVHCQGGTVGVVIDELERQFPGLRDCLCAEGEIRPGIAIVVGGSVSSLGLLQRVGDDEELHFIPTVGGGT